MLFIFDNLHYNINFKLSDCFLTYSFYQSLLYWKALNENLKGIFLHLIYLEMVYLIKNKTRQCFKILSKKFKTILVNRHKADLNSKEYVICYLNP